MNEEQWLACDEPRRMIAYLQTMGKAGGRKCRLLMCALARSLWADLPDVQSRAANEAAEAFADGCLGADALRDAAAHARLAHDESREAFIAARRAAGGKYRKHVKQAAARADASAVAAWSAADEPLSFWDWDYSMHVSDPLDYYDSIAAVESLLRKQSGLVFDLFGNPFSPAALDVAWLAWEDGSVARLASAIYDGRRFEDMPILADALEDAGCREDELLEHLRSPGPHARGCHVLDLLTGRSLSA
jgi:hypothetical protein